MDIVEATVRQFVERINARDVTGLVTLMTDVHVFIDAAGGTVRGLETLAAAWTGYFAWMPDYTILVKELFILNNMVALFGSACGTYAVQGQLLAENHWELPGAWKAVVVGGKVAEWRVYCDTKPVFDIMTRNEALSN